MSVLVTLFLILGALLVGAVSPGPSFVLVSRVALESSRRNGWAAAIGMGTGGAIFAIVALLGLMTILRRVELLYLALRVLGGLYLFYLGIRIWRGAPEPLEGSGAGVARPLSALRSFVLGLLTQLSNPKTAIVYASIFASLLPSTAPTWLFVSLPPLVFAVEASWYAIVATAFSASVPRSAYLHFKAWVDRIAGAVMGALGARLFWETYHSRS